MSNTFHKDNLLHRLGDDWHAVSPYLPLIEKIVPHTKYASDIQDILYSLYVDQHYNFKQSKSISKNSLYSDEAEFSEGKIKQLQEDMKKEEKIFEALAKKFEEVQDYLTYSSNNVDEEEEEDDYVPTIQDKGKGNMTKTKAKKLSPQEQAKILEEKKKALQAYNTKLAMATSQQKLLDFQKDIEQLEKKKEYYKHYHFALYGRSCGIKKLVLEYEKNKNIETLIEGLDDLVTYYEKMRRRNIPSTPCEGVYQELCASHFLPFATPAVYSEKGTIVHEAKCSLNPIA